MLLRDTFCAADSAIKYLHKAIFIRHNIYWSACRGWIDYSALLLSLSGDYRLLSVLYLSYAMSSLSVYMVYERLHTTCCSLICYFYAMNKHTTDRPKETETTQLTT